MICITGAGGTVGSEIIKYLEKSNIPFCAAYYSKRKADEAKAKGINTVIIDYNKKDTLISAFKNCNKIFLLGPNVENQSELEINVVDAAKSAGVTHIIKLSSTNAHKESYSIGIVHRAVEKAIETSGIEWTFLRCNQYMQNLVTFAAETIKSEDTIYTASADAKISQLDARDIAEVLFYIVTEEGHKNKVYSLTGPNAITYDEVASEISTALGRDIKHISLSPEDYKNAMIAEGISEEISNRLTDLERYFREGEPSFISDDIKRITGHNARNFKDFVKDISATGVWN